MRASERLSKIELRRPYPCVFSFVRTEILVRVQKKGCALRSLAGELGRLLSERIDARPNTFAKTVLAQFPKPYWPNPTCRGLQAKKLRHSEKRGERRGDTKVVWTAGMQVQSSVVAKGLDWINS
jgi:hypothetical protein